MLHSLSKALLSSPPALHVETSRSFSGRAQQQPLFSLYHVSKEHARHTWAPGF